MKFDIGPHLEKLNGLDIKARYGIFAGILIVLVLADYFLIINMQRSGINSLEADTKTLVADIERVQADKQRIHQIRENLEKARKELDAMNLKLRPRSEVPMILEDISRIANDVGLKIDQLMPLKESQETLINSPEGNYYALPIVIQGHCGYHIFGRFLNQLERANLYFTIRDARIESNPKSQDSHIVQATIKVILVDKDVTGTP